ncbi:hypothetical protein [Cryptosporangium aurantiacum]|uniref:Nicotinate-nucleotide pyrophosphorylase (Carboxylating) n=1 Tax=Cryptosporangium aurantiacum TaxID=134849 RepID=A0A1M7PEY6_9ACTN|nr:hypothetical protein [Cryptosporangium aurantiacum]SHN15542.1 nicotinate-nucleotide pyrophosphorylase (carboxylating) [Cryptosporangium aurantiacum]
MTRSAYRALTQELLQDVPGRHRAVVSPTEPGVVAGLGHLDPGIGRGEWRIMVADGATAKAGEPLIEIVGTAGELAAAEDHVLGALGYAGGVARRCRELRSSCPTGLRIACGGWKKLPAPLKPLLRAGLDAGGVTPRLIDGEFVYVDKNVVRLLGGVEAAAAGAAKLDHGPSAVQVTSAADAVRAARAGVGIVMVDTGDLATLTAAHRELDAAGLRGTVVLAFAGGVTSDDLVAVWRAGAEVVDLGRAILDAPLWDLHVEVADPAG